MCSACLRTDLSLSLLPSPRNLASKPSLQSFLWPFELSLLYLLGIPCFIVWLMAVHKREGNALFLFPSPPQKQSLPRWHSWAMIIPLLKQNFPLPASRSACIPSLRWTSFYWLTFLWKSPQICISSMSSPSYLIFLPGPLFPFLSAPYSFLILLRHPT